MSKSTREKFNLDKGIIKEFKTKTPKFGFGVLGELTFYRTYSRLKENGRNEDWTDCVERVVNGTYSIQKRHIISNGLGWDEVKAQESASEMFERIWNFKFTPPGRGLWAMGTDIIEERGLGAALNNCAFTTTLNIDKEFSKPFEFLMDMSMLGVGVGFDVKGENKLTIKKPVGIIKYTIPDTREGWVDSLGILINAYFKGEAYPEFDYSKIRPEGAPIKTFGGVSSGPDPLKRIHTTITDLLDKVIGKPISITNITDIMNWIGVCVVAGNVRRTAEIVFGPNKAEYLDLKNYKINEHRQEFGWTSNNSIFADVGMDYSIPAQRTSINGEPGYEYLQNAQDYGRMCEARNYKDKKAMGGNPCLEQTLEDKELCNLVETFPEHHDSIEDYQRTLKFAYLYSKTVTLVSTHWVESNRVMLRNRRIGLSQSGIAMFLDRRGIHEYKRWCEIGYKTIQHYDELYSDWLAIPRSIKTTSVKPSGTVSLLAGASPGIHFPERDYYIRRIRISKLSKLWEICKKGGYHVEEDKYDSSSMVVEVPVSKLEGVRTVEKVSMWEQVWLATFVQRYWADNQVSCTVSSKEHEADQIKQVLNYAQYDLKGISFLPKTKEGAYEQMPYEGITKEEFIEKAKDLKLLNLKALSEDSTVEKFCNNDSCII